MTTGNRAPVKETRRWRHPAPPSQSHPTSRWVRSARHTARRRGSPPVVVARHTVTTSTSDYQLILVAGERIGRRGLSEAISDAVAELRAIDVTYSPLRRNSLVSLLRRGEVSAEVYPPLADIVGRCEAMRTATDGWFDPWAVPGGFDPAGMIKGWAIERAASRLRAAGICDYAVVSGGDLTVRGHAPHGGPWRIALRQSSSAASGGTRTTIVTMVDGAIGTSGMTNRRGPVIDPRTGAAVHRAGAAMVLGADLAIADGYATALYAAGTAGHAWFPTVDGYRPLGLVDVDSAPSAAGRLVDPD
ncbi:FAD:protein FMN transferase [Solwaraspora sp. WMMD406]|uniref:FAD:protein FMN transferase n=1 Tax=Solwaraspora sp. WMMD406 TaxID=3016095 RepID=UPI00241725EB|nr:FAD:protein FMN transferase [Solwaraspora sp. WMMD406]MDG4767285.1 FAD:protein FMN transferase [Solwaraspora sp. WMMD406]